MNHDSKAKTQLFLPKSIVYQKTKSPLTKLMSHISYRIICYFYQYLEVPSNLHVSRKLNDRDTNCLQNPVSRTQ